MPVSTLTAKGQTTIPKAIRDHLKLQPGNRIDFVVEADGRVVLRPATRDVRALEGVLYDAGRTPLSLEDMGEAIRRRGSRRSSAG